MNDTKLELIRRVSDIIIRLKRVRAGSYVLSREIADVERMLERLEEAYAHYIDEYMANLLKNANSNRKVS